VLVKRFDVDRHRKSQGGILLEFAITDVDHHGCGPRRSGMYHRPFLNKAGLLGHHGQPDHGRMATRLYCAVPQYLYVQKQWRTIFTNGRSRKQFNRVMGQWITKRKYLVALQHTKICPAWYYHRLLEINCALCFAFH
jgi:hypothetical protein